MARQRYIASVKVKTAVKTKIVIALIIVLPIAMSALGFYWLYQWNNPGYKPIPFRKEQWAKADPETRGHMARDMMKQHQLVGMTRQEIETLLGPPNNDQVDLQRYRYLLGNMGRNPEGLGFFAGYSLLIKFNAANKATEAHTAD